MRSIVRLPGVTAHVARNYLEEDLPLVVSLVAVGLITYAVVTSETAKSAPPSGPSQSTVLHVDKPAPVAPGTIAAIVVLVIAFAVGASVIVVFGRRMVFALRGPEIRVQGGIAWRGGQITLARFFGVAFLVCIILTVLNLFSLQFTNALFNVLILVIFVVIYWVLSVGLSILRRFRPTESGEDEAIRQVEGKGHILTRMFARRNLEFYTFGPILRILAPVFYATRYAPYDARILKAILMRKEVMFDKDLVNVDFRNVVFLGELIRLSSSPLAKDTWADPSQRDTLYALWHEARRQIAAGAPGRPELRAQMQEEFSDLVEHTRTELIARAHGGDASGYKMTLQKARETVAAHLGAAAAADYSLVRLFHVLVNSQRDTTGTEEFEE